MSVYAVFIYVEEIFMKKFLMLMFASSIILVCPSIAASCPPVTIISPAEKLDTMSSEASEYLPIWVVEEGEKSVIRKFIWVPTEDGKKLVIIEATNDALLRLAWNLDTYKHDPTKIKVKTN